MYYTKPPYVCLKCLYMNWLAPVLKIKKIILLIGDIAILYLSLYLALLLRYGAAYKSETWRDNFLPFSFVFFIWLVIFYVAGLYEDKTAKNEYAFYASTAKTVILAVVVAVLIFYSVSIYGVTPKIILLLLTVIFFALFLLWRRGYNSFIKSAPLLHNIIFTGINKEAKQIIDMLSANPQLGYKVAGVLDRSDLPKIKEIVAARHINTLVHVKDSSGGEDETVRALYSLIPLEINIIELPKFYAQVTHKVPVSIIGEAWFLENLIAAEKDVYKMWKWLFDVLLALVWSAFLLPFLPLVALAVKLDSVGPVFYRQVRTGKNGKLFNLLKFRTMVNDAEKKGAQWTTARDARITKVGGILRKFRIDELPQLWNVLRGDMSFVGPRPERPEFIQKLEREVPFYQMRHIVKPGLTGLAQIYEPLLGAGTEDSLEKLQYDLYYIKNRSLFIDFDIIIKTIPIIISRRGH